MMFQEKINPDMAEDNYSRIDNDQLMQTSISDVSLWTKSTEKALQERSDVINGVVQNQRADYLRAVLEHGWDVNEMLQVYGSGRGRVKRTALHHAVYYRWYEGVRLLPNAGADCNIKCEWSGEADLSVPHLRARYHRHFHSETLAHTPLCVAIYKDDLEMVKLLLKNGQDLQESGCDSIQVNLDRLMVLYDLYQNSCKGISTKENGQILNVLLTNGTNIGKNLAELLQHYISHKMFFQEHLDVLFTHGADLEFPYQGSTLGYVVGGQGPINTIRWLLRHGASCTPSLSPILRFEHESIQRYRLPLMEVFLQVGVKHSNSLKVHLGKLEMRIQAYLQQGDSGDQDDDFVKKTLSIYTDILCSELGHRLDKELEKFPIDREQMAHLREFSDLSLDVYPEELNMTDNKRECWEQTLKRVSNIVHFLNQPHTLQWHCRVCLRESLVSLSPSVIRKLPVPASLKRFILCHNL